MVASGDILQIAQEFTYASFANRGMNVYQYEVTVDAPFLLSVDGQEFVNDWYAQQTALLQPITNEQIVWQDTHIVNLSDPLEIWVGQADALTGGLVAGDCLPPYAAWGFKLNRTNASTRNGSKRFPGVSESQQLNGNPTAGAATLLATLAPALASGMSITLDDLVQLNPVIVRKDNTGGLIASQRVASAQFRSISTQNTRKFGRGM